MLYIWNFSSLQMVKYKARVNLSKQNFVTFNVVATLKEAHKPEQHRLS